MTELETHPAASETRLCEKVFPKQANHYGTLFGGTAPSLMGKAAFIAASHHARAAVAMARSGANRVSPSRLGRPTRRAARLNRAGWAFLDDRRG